MTEPIQIGEYEEWAGELADEDRDFLKGSFSDKFTLRREVRENATLCIVNPKQYVGLLTLPSGTKLQINPKVPVSNLFYMVSKAFDLPWPFRDEVVQLAPFEDILAVIAQIFADLVEARIRAGLYRSYVEEEENLRCVRGRISFTEDIRHNLLARNRVYCRYAELTWDIEENQVIRQAVHLLSGWDFSSKLRLRLSHLDAALAEIRPTALPSSVISQFHYNRLNEDYRHIHQFCRLFLEGSSLSEELGAWDSRAFLFDMNRLFESFVTKLLQDRSRGPLMVSAQVPLTLGEECKINIQPDIVIGFEGIPALVADCKYKQTESETFRNHDWYQVLAYCIATQTHRGLLIYPLGSEQVGDIVKIKNVDVVIEQTTINLGLPFQDFKEHCQDCADAIVDRVSQPDLSLTS